jgi:hypothetical protein
MTHKILGPEGSKRRRRFWLVPMLVAALATVFWVTGSQAVNNTGAFELEGNAVSTTGNAGTGADDWDRVCQEIVGGNSCSTTATTQTTAPKSTARTWIDGQANPTIYTGGGSKDPNDVSAWLWKPKDTVPDKDTLRHAFAARYSLDSSSTCPGPNGDTSGTTKCEVIFFGMDRFANDGDAQLGFWFFQDRVGLTNTASQGGFKFSGVHINGDLLLISDFSNGGSTSTISAYFWDTTCTKADNNNPQANQCASANLRLKAKSDNANCSTSNATANFCGIVNPHLASDPNAETSPWPFTDKKGNVNKYDQGEFYEGGVNLSGLGIGGECFSAIAAESRSSTSPTSVLKDFVLGGFGECTSGLVTTPNAGKGGSVPIGSNGTYSATDSAELTISGATNWTGTLKFFICAPLASGSCDGTTNVGTQVGADRTVTNTTTHPFVSDAYSVTAAGRYCWRAEFTSGTTGVPDAKDGSTDECFTVTPLTPTINTQVKKVIGDSNVTSGSTVPIGTAVYDTAILSSSTTNAGGTVRYRLYTNNTCTTLDTSTAGTAFNSQADVTVTNATVPKSANITLNTAGTFYFQATYQTGDANNVAGATSACTSETVIVQAAPVVHSTPVVQIKDSVTVTGLSASPTGNLVVGIYTDNTCTTRLSGNIDETFSIGGIQPFVTNFQGVLTGNYWYKLSYAGDTNNASFSSCDEKVAVTITAKP